MLEDEAKHACHECGGNISFPAASAGTDVHCPHCGTKTTLGELYLNMASQEAKQACAECGTELSFRSESAGKDVFCPLCGERAVLGANVGTNTPDDSAKPDPVLANSLAGSFRAGMNSAERSVNGTPSQNSDHISTAAGTILIVGTILVAGVVALVFEAITSRKKTVNAPPSAPAVQSSPSGPTISQKVTERTSRRDKQLSQRNLLVEELKPLLELTHKFSDTMGVVGSRWNNALNTTGGNQLEIIRSRIIPLVRDLRDEATAFRSQDVKVKRIHDDFVSLVNTNMAYWIEIHNHAARNDWQQARLEFDRMNLAYQSGLRSLNESAQSLNRN